MGSKNRLLWLNLSLVYLNLGPPDRSLVPRDVQEASRAEFGAISDLSGRLWKPKIIVKYKGFAVFHIAPQTSSRSSKSAPWKAQNDPQEAPRDAPGAAQKASRRLQERHKRPTSTPRAAQRRLPSGLGAKLGPTGTKEPSEGLSEALLDLPRAGFAPSGGRFSDSCVLSESVTKAVLWAKLAQANAQHRFASLCTFYMWISTATDSRSRSTNPCINR